MSILTVTPTEVFYEDHADGDNLFSLIREQVGGHVQAVALEGDRVMWVHEDGKALAQPVNPRATEVMRAAGSTFPGDWVAGTAVITGRSGPETAPLNDDQLGRTYRELAIH
ncbi:DUF3846 domain-containing protein [Streptomyces sp. 549]|uniref:DUF3846 domain-containing protein n=1 Tax=Streptomyces sp. 549 TaxID=3049076 RepID=UPI0024C26943|nr:DUF3846 domain-containing protein [Streptomyces sp. 549]MDK1476824.1 DUF3846 domain-containing protein [Streptomyces sp. 549]